MAGGYGSEKNGVSLGAFWDSITVSSDGSQARIVGAEIRIHRDVNISDSTNSLSWSGGAVNDGSSSNISVSGSGTKTIKSVTGQWQDLVYGSTKSASFAASMSGVDYAGGTISVSKSITYPAREYSAPIAPTDLIWKNPTPGNFTLEWSNESTEAAPWTTVILLETEYGGATTSITLSNPSTIKTIARNGLALNKRYYWQLKITNEKATVTSAATSVTPIPLHTMTFTPSSVSIDGSVTFTINKNGSSNTSSIYFMKNGVKTVVLDKVSGTSYSYTFAKASWLSYLANTASLPFVVGIETFSGTTSLGVNTYSITVTVPNAAPYLPVSNLAVASEQNSTIVSKFGPGIFVKGKSKIRYTWSGTAGEGATITKREILLKKLGATTTTVIDVTSTSIFEEVPSGTGNTITMSTRTTDSRGRTHTSAESTITVYDYSEPTITKFTAERCTVDGTSSNAGEHAKFTIALSASSVKPSTTELNMMQYRVSCLDASGNEITPSVYSKALNDTLTAPEFTTGAIPGASDPSGDYSIQSGYTFRLTLNDSISGSITKVYSILSEVYPLTIGTNGISIGKVYNDSTKAIDAVGDVLITGKLKVTGLVEMTVPTHTHAASDIISGTLDAARIPSLDTSKITSGTLAVARLPAATETAIGAVERATNAEAITGTDTTRYLSPANLTAVLGNTESTSALAAITAGSGITLSSVYLHRRGGFGYCLLTFSRNAVIGNGDHGNFEVGTIVDSAYWPLVGSPMQTLGAGSQLGYCSPSGVIIASYNASASSIASGTSQNMAGFWII